MILDQFFDNSLTLYSLSIAKYPSEITEMSYFFLVIEDYFYLDSENNLTILMTQQAEHF